MKTCVWCKRNEQIDAYVGVCSLQCSRAYEAYERGKVDERAKALSGANAYLKQAITEATEQAYAMGRDWSRVNERNRIADALDAESGNYDLADKPSVWVLRFAERLRKGEV